jgi:hypothetical protein
MASWAVEATTDTTARRAVEANTTWASVKVTEFSADQMTDAKKISHTWNLL